MPVKPRRNSSGDAYEQNTISSARSINPEITQSLASENLKVVGGIHNAQIAYREQDNSVAHKARVVDQDLVSKNAIANQQLVNAIQAMHLAGLSESLITHTRNLNLVTAAGFMEQTRRIAEVSPLEAASAEQVVTADIADRMAQLNTEYSNLKAKVDSEFADLLAKVKSVATQPPSVTATGDSGE